MDAQAVASHNLFAGCLLLDELQRCGVRRIFVAPGSRSTPLALAAALHPGLQTTVHWDERGAAFAALGYGRAGHGPAALICSSGTAAANFYPAVVEAAQDRVPMLLLTADRPPELRDAGANQAIDQVGLFGRYPRYQVDLPTADSGMPWTALLTSVDRAVDAATRCPAGPVHLNCPFREPFVPSHFLSHRQTLVLADLIGDDGLFPSDAPALLPLRRHLAGSAPYTRYEPGIPTPCVLPPEVAVRRLLVVVGAVPLAEQEAVAALAAKLALPVVGDVRSGLRFGPGLRHLDYLFGRPALAAELKPDAILHLGDACVSKRYGQYLATHPEIPLIVAAPHAERQDPTHNAAVRLVAEPADLLRALAKQPVDEAWREGLQALDAAIAEIVAAHCSTDAPHGLPIARALSEDLGPDESLFLGASLPVRELDWAAPQRPNHTPVSANRGASGIDGTVASVCGLVIATARPATLYLGDLTLLHDLNSLALLARSPQPIRVVVLNNDGGGIFSLLPIARETTQFESHFAVPHGLHFAHAAAQFGLAYHRAESVSEFRTAYAALGAAACSGIVELIGDRAANETFLRTLTAALSETDTLKGGT